MFSLHFREKESCGSTAGLLHENRISSALVQFLSPLYHRVCLVVFECAPFIDLLMKTSANHGSISFRLTEGIVTPFLRGEISFPSSFTCTLWANMS